MAIEHRDRRLDVVVYGFAIFTLIVTAYPIIFVFFMSISTPDAVFLNKIRFLPNALYLDTYASLLSREELWLFYYNTVYIVAFGTAINIILTVVAGYVLSRRDFRLRNVAMAMMVITMFFQGGIIPFYLVVRSLGLINTRWSLILPFAINAFHVIIARTYIQSSIPESLHESATIDGASKLRILVSIVAPLTKPLIAVIGLWSAVFFWNSYFWPLVFIRDQGKQPIQIFLQKLLVLGQAGELGLLEGAAEAGIMLAGRSGTAEQMKYVAIVVTIVPILCVYPFVQKYFIRGVMLGALKG